MVTKYFEILHMQILQITFSSKFFVSKFGQLP